MPKKYSVQEKENIRKDLLLHASRSLFHKGVQDISVDELVKKAGIPKGTFYLFYKSKEELFIDLLVSFRLDVQEEMLSMLQELDENHIVTSLTTVFSHLAEELYSKGIYRLLDEQIYRLLDEQQLQIISRKSDEDIFKRESGALLDFFKELFGYFAIDDSSDIAAFFSAFMMIVFSMESAQRIKNPLSAWRLLLRGLMLQLVGE